MMVERRGIGLAFAMAGYSVIKTVVSTGYLKVVMMVDETAVLSAVY